MRINRGDFDRVARREERGPPIVDEAFIYNYETLDIVELVGGGLPMQRDEEFLIFGKSRKVGIQYSDPPHLFDNGSK